MPSPIPIHFVGGSPAPYHEAYPAHYVPPPHYSVELPKYDYDKRMPENYHCCGCPNHHCHQNVNKGVKIEEQGSPDVVEKNANDSLVPDQMINYPHPIVWIPPEYMYGGEQRKLSGPEIVEEKKTPKPPESLKSREEDRKHGLFPFDIDNIGSLMQGGNGERVQDQRGEDRKREFPFPIVWMPSYDNKHDGVGKKDEDMDASRDQQTEEQEKQFPFPFPFPFFWLPYENKQKDVGKEEENEDNRKVIANPRFVPQKHAGSGDNEARVNEEKSAELGVPEGKEKDANGKVILVKHMDFHKDNSEDTKRRGREVHVKHGDDKLADKPSDNTVRSQSSSPKKSSRLPPVCLRVDPLPSKKSGSGRSRSPSPSGPKQVQKETSTDTAINSGSCDLRENSNGKEVEPPEKEKVIQVVDKGISENKDQETGKIGDKIAQNVEETENTSSSAKSATKFERKSLSDVAAAVLIQSSYRGFMVRRWEPLKKLKQIAEIREQVSDIQNQITSLETSDLKKDDKQKMIIGETIMRLLLRLDTIQGLLPSLRDIRRSLAKELVLLQEKLDDLMTKSQEASTVKTEEELGANGNSNFCMVEQQGEGARLDEISHAATVPCQGQVIHTLDSLPGVEVEVPKISGHKELDTASENVQHELPVASGPNSKNLDSGPTMESKDNDVDGQVNAGHAVVVDAEMSNGATDLEQCGEVPAHVEDKTDHSVVPTSSDILTITPELLEELHQVAADNEPATSEPEKDEPLEMSKDELKQGGEVELTMPPDVTSSIATDHVTEKDAEIHELAALPLGTTDEDSCAVSELKKNEEVLMAEENKISKSGEEESQEALLQQQQEETMEELVKVEHEVQEELPVDAVLDPEVEHQQQNEALSLPVETGTHEVVQENGPSDMTDGDDSCFSVFSNAEKPNEDEVSVVANAEKPNEDELPVEKSIEEYKDLQAMTIKDDAEMHKSKAESDDNENGQSDDIETAKENIVLEKSEALPASPIATAVSSIDGTSVVGDESARKLIEENEKLRDMMQKLMAAGKDQSQVISDLTSKVTNLEKKLAKKKKLRTRRCRAATSRSCVKPPNNH